jgi:hypothetical protein
VIGSISIHANGSVTVKTIQGKLSILNQDHVVLAALSSKDSVTIPSITVGGKPPVRVAVVGETIAGEGGGTIFGASVTTVIAVLVGAGAIAGIVVGAVALHKHHKHEEEEVPVCQ